MDTGNWELETLLRASLLGHLLANVRHRDERRVHPFAHHFTVDDNPCHILAGRELVHRIEQYLLEDGSQAASTRAPKRRLVRHGDLAVTFAGSATL